MGSNNHTLSGNKSTYKSLTSPIGIDIGSSQIKIVQLLQKAGNITHVNHAQIPTPDGSIAEGRINDPEKLCHKLRQLKKKMPLKGSQANLCLGPEAHYLRLIELPPLSKKDLQKTLPWELEKHFPLKANKAVYDYCLLSDHKRPGNDNIKYILAAAEADTATTLTETAEKAGFIPLSLETSPLSLLRIEALGRNGHSLKKCSNGKALLDIGYRSSTLLLAGNGVLKYCRHLRFGVLDFLKEISFTNDISRPESQRIIFLQDPLAVGTTKSAEMLAEQITGSIGYYLDQSGAGGTEPSLMAVSGGGSAIPGLIKYLHSKLSLKVELQQLPAFCGRRPGSNASAPQANPALYATAFGLALRGWLR